MPKALHLSFANLTCRFGERFVLIDLAKEVIYPAFFDRSYSRKYGPTAYFFVMWEWQRLRLKVWKDRSSPFTEG
jgi:hypothetical protein